MTPEQRINVMRNVMRADSGSTIVEIAAALRDGGTPVKESVLRSSLHAFKEHFVQDVDDPEVWYLRYTSPDQAVDQPSHPAANTPLYPWQEEALASWTAAGRSGVVEAVTGAGKSRLAVAAAVERVASGGFATIIVPTVDLLYQWRETVESDPAALRVGLLGDSNDDLGRRPDVLIAVVHSASRRDVVAGRSGGLLIADECHRYGAPAFAKALEEGYADRLGLTATLERSDDGVDEVLLPYFGSVVFSYDFRTAIREKVCAPVRVGLVGVDLDSQERSRYDSASRTMGDAIHQLESRCGLRFEPFWKFMADVSLLAEQQQRSLCRSQAQAFLSAMAERRDILASASAKIGAIKAIAPLVGAAGGCILFTETKASASAVVAALRQGHVVAEVLTGDADRDERRRALDGLRSGRLDAIAAPRILDEGIDAPSVDLGVIVAASRSRRQMIQRMGRVLRRKPDGRSANFLIFFVRDTHEDPAKDAHAEFLAEMLDVAQTVEVFGSSNAEALRRFMDGTDAQGSPLTRPSGPQPTTAPEKDRTSSRRPTPDVRRGRRGIFDSDERDERVAAALGWQVETVLRSRLQVPRVRSAPAQLRANVPLAKRAGLTVAELAALLDAERTEAKAAKVGKAKPKTGRRRREGRRR